MTGYGRERERRRRSRALLGVGFVVLLGASLSLRTGVVPVVAVLAGALVLAYVIANVLLWRDKRSELRRRAAGAPPSWPAQLPIQMAQLLGVKAPGQHARRVDEVGELLGRLSLIDGELNWQPREADRKRGAGTFVFDRSWSAEVVPIWGPGSQGCLTLTRPDGTAVDLWIRHPADLRATLQPV